TGNFLGVGDEFRYRPSEGTKGHVLGYMVRDSEALDQKWRWKVEWNHETTDLPWGMRGVVQYQDFSDFNFFRDFERDFDRNTLRFIDSRAFVTGNWGPHLLNVLLSDRQTFVGTTTTSSSVDQRKLPEIEYRLRSTQLWKTPFYLQFDGSVSYLDLARPGSYAGQYGRVDAFPEITLPIRTFPWLALSVTGGERLTWYGDSLTQATPQSPLTLGGDPFSRTVPFGSAEIVGPSFSRIFDQGILGLGKMKHVIEPRFTYTYLGDIDDAKRTPLFDDVDAIASTNSGRVALVNRILAKPKPKKKPVTAPAVTAAGAAGATTPGTAATATAGTTITGSAGTTVTPVGTSPGIAAPPPATATAAQTAAAATASLPAATMGTPASTASTSDSTGVPGAGNSVLPVNPVLATIPATEDEGSAREVFSLELARRISFDNQRPLQTSRNGQVQTTQGPLEASVRFNPSDRTSVRFEADYDTLFKGISSTQLSGDFSFGTGNSLTLTWFTAAIPELKKTTGDQVRVSGSAGIFKSLRVEGQINYDFENKLLQEQRIVFNWTQQCYGLRLELRDFRSAVGPRTRDKDVRLSLSLKNVGTFLDLSGRSSTVEP
ncbi:MAG TPA: LPS assembly protein LptD, partial [Nocardioidaceae bacterium]|nr:LPS assembly protein LptD [Nocardioidaceae bacterium]